MKKSALLALLLLAACSHSAPKLNYTVGDNTDLSDITVPVQQTVSIKVKPSERITDVQVTDAGHWAYLVSVDKHAVAFYGTDKTQGKKTDVKITTDHAAYTAELHQ